MSPRFLRHSLPPIALVLALLLLASPAHTAGSIAAWQDPAGHLWVETGDYLWDVSHGSRCLVKLGPEPRDWAVENLGIPEVEYSQTTGTFQWSVYLGQGGGNLLAPGEYAGGQYLQTAGTITVLTPEVAILDFYGFLSAPSHDFPVATTMTFRADRPVVSIEYSVGPVFPDPYPPAIEYALTLVPGGDRDGDYLYWSGRDTAAPFPYDSWAGPVTVDQIDPVTGADGQQYAFITDYDTAAGQGLAYFARVDRTADFVTDLSYGRMAAYDTRGSRNFCYLALAMDATQHGPFSILLYEPDPVTPWQPAVDFIAAYANAPVAAFIPTSAAGTAPLRVDFTDISLGAPTSWHWDFGDGATSTDQHPGHEYADAGTYTVSLTASNAAGSDTAVRPHCVLVTFPDVPLDHWALPQILACVDAGIAQGYPGGDYRPEEPVTRGQMAVYIARALAGGDDYVPTGPVAPTFGDVGEDHWAYRYVEYCAGLDIAQGYWNDTYRPDEVVSRGQMAVYIARSIATPTGDAGVPDPVGPPAFSDVTAEGDSAWCYKYVQYIATLDPAVVQGYSDGTYHPERPVTRDQMAVYIARAFQLPM